jgi:ribosomal protein S27AE
MSISKVIEKVQASENNVFAAFNRAQFEKSAYVELSEKDYYTRYRALYWFAVVLALLAQVGSLVSEYSYFEAIALIKLTGWAATIAAGLFVITLEFAKFYVINRLFADVFRLAGVRVAYGLAIVAIGISALSVWASIQGGGSLAINPQAIESATSPYATEIATLRQEIADIKQRNTWKGQTWISGADKKLLHAKEQQLSAAITAKDKAVREAKDKESANVTAYQYGFSALEAVFLVCTLFVYYFKKRVAIESLAAAPTRPEPAPVLQTFAQTTESANGNRAIGFRFSWQNANENRNNENRINENRINENRNDSNSNLRTCPNCGKQYIYKHHKQIYCCEECRIESWEKRTGKKFKKK